MRQRLRGNMTLTIERCRELLGPEAEGKTDEQLQALVEELSRASAAFYDEIQAAWRRDPESVRWAVYSHQTGEVE